LRLGDADGQFSIAPFRELLQHRFGLLAEIHIARAVDFSRDPPDFFRERLFQAVKGAHRGAGFFAMAATTFSASSFAPGPPFANPSERALATPRSAQYSASRFRSAAESWEND